MTDGINAKVDCSALCRVEGAEKQYHSGRRSREADLESAAMI